MPRVPGWRTRGLAGIVTCRQPVTRAFASMPDSPAPTILAAREVSCRSAPAPLRLSGPTAFAPSATLVEWELDPQSLVELRSGSQRVMVWLRSATEFRKAHSTSGDADCDLWLSRRARDALRIEGSASVSVHLPLRTRLVFESARIDDLPQGCEVDVSRATAIRMGGTTGWALLVWGDRAMPVSLRVRNLAEGHVRLSMLTRSLMGITPDAPKKSRRRRVPAPPSRPTDRTVLLCALPPEPSWLHRIQAPMSPGARRAPAALARGVSRLLMGLLERVLQPALGAPRFAYRTREALIGDDVHSVVRLPPSCFPMLGIRPGDQVILTWARRRCIAVALEQVPLTVAASRGLRTHQMVDLATASARKPEDHLDIEVAASLRHVLGLPRDTVLQVQRRLWTQLSVRLSALLIPVGGLLLAAAAIQGFRPLWIWLGMAAIAVFEILHLRLPAPPRGRWH